MRDCDVVVVGAGLAGLTLARRLAWAGLDVVVLEARDRVGGRTLSREIHGAVFDLGAQWIGPAQVRLRHMLDELGMQTFPQHHQGTKVLDHDGRRRTYKGDIPSLSLIDLVRTEMLIRKVDRMATGVPLEMPYHALRGDEWDRTTVEEMKRRMLGKSEVKRLFDVAVRTIFGAEPSEVSLLYFLFYLNSAGGFRSLVDIDGGAQQERFVGGAQAMAKQLAANLGAERVLLSAPVHTVVHDDHGVVVKSDAGDFAAKRVVIAVPPPLVARLRFVPELPAVRSQLVQRWPMGATTKVFVFYDRAGWRTRGLSGEAVSTSGPISVVFDACSHDGRVPCLLGFVVGKHARAWARLSASERRATAVAEMERMFDMPASAVVDYVEQDWGAEPWTGGCPVASMGSGVLSVFGDSWRSTIGRIHWAGTERARHWNGYLEGALESAERVASEVAHFLD